MRLRKNKSLIDKAKDQASDVVDAALPVIESAVTTVREQLEELGKDAAENAKDLAQETREKAGPLMAEAKLLAGELAEATRVVAVPKAKAAALAGAEKAGELASSGRDLAAAKVAEVKGEPQKKRGSRLRKLLLFSGLVALGGFVAKKFRARPQHDNWQSSYAAPSPASTTSATSSSGSAGAGTGGAHLAPGVGPDEPVGVDDPMVAAAEADAAGASPDEAIADAVEEPHPVTTPDDPAEVVDVEQAEKK